MGRYLIKNLINRPERVFLVLSLFFGLLFVFITPPFEVPDETSHFYKTFDVSYGHLIPQGNTMQIPTSVLNLQIFLHDETTNFSKNYHSLFYPLNINKTSEISISNIAIYPPVPYLASGTIIFFGSLFNFSPILLLYLGRLINLLIYIVLVYFGIKIIPIYKHVLLLPALMPMTLHEAGSLSADSLNLALSFLTFSFFLYLSLVKNKIKTNDILISIILVFLLAFSKQAYSLLVLLFFMIPKEKFKNGLKRIYSFLKILCLPLTTVIIWNLLFKGMYASKLLNGNHRIEDYNIHFILSNPLNFPYILINTLITNFQDYLITFVGSFRWNTTSLPFSLIIVYWIILVVVSLADNSKYKLPYKQKIIPLFIFLIVSLLVFLFEFITYTTPIGYKFIEGVQGRYFIPVFPLFLLIFYNSKLSNYILGKIKFKKNISEIFHIFIYLFIIIYLIISSYLIMGYSL